MPLMEKNAESDYSLVITKDVWHAPVMVFGVVLDSERRADQRSPIALEEFTYQADTPIMRTAL